MRKRNIEWEQNQILTTPALFLKAYNDTIPVGFPRASTKALRLFQVAHPALFKQSESWSIERHRKRLMDWLSSHQDAAE